MGNNVCVGWVNLNCSVCFYVVQSGRKTESEVSVQKTSNHGWTVEDSCVSVRTQRARMFPIRGDVHSVGDLTDEISSG